MSSNTSSAASAKSGSPDKQSEIAETHYFAANPAPRTLSQHVALAREFIDHHATSNRRVVLITSGGTTVPLEKQTVRYIDNFSAGTRGSTSAEFFLEAGYAVIFLHRQFSLLPYSRHYSHATDCFLDFLGEGPGGSVVVNPQHQEKMLAVLRKYNSARRNNMLLTLPFVTITDYLFELRAVASLMRPLGPNALLYLAAAVSDFFIPPERMAEHKIQSTDAADVTEKTRGPEISSTSSWTQPDGPPTKPPAEEDEAFDNFDSSPQVPRSKRLVVDLDPVPKFLKNLVDGWAPAGMIVSFKLETDPDLLVHKARYSLERYQHSLVIGNLLATRKWEVVFVSPARPERWIRVPLHRRKKTISGLESMVGAADRYFNAAPQDGPLDPATLPERDPEMEIESLIIPAVEELHSAHIQSYRDSHADEG